MLPNILVTGTPGTGKTTVCEMIGEATGMKHVNIGDLVKREKLHSGWDEEYDCYIIDEDKVIDELEDQISTGGNIVDYHGCDFFPERWFDLVLVLQTDNTILFERLEKRKYSPKKITENVECEIMQVIAEEAMSSYRPEIVHLVPSNTYEDLESIVERAVSWLQQCKR